VTSPALELVGIQKSFGSVHAVRGADFTLNRGEVHALLGENGAGKSTLMRIAAGLIEPEQGEVVVNGTRAALRSPRDARRVGIGMVHQHFTSVPAFSVQDNVALGSDWPIRPAELSRRVLALNERLGFTLDPRERAKNLPVAALQRLEILKVLASDASILILDEPTGSLTPAEAEELLALVRRLVKRGSSAVLITHKLDEAIRFADQVTVLRRGRVTLAGPIDGRSATELAQAMLGESLADRIPRQTILPGALLVNADGIRVAPLTGKGPGIRNGSFRIYAGEMVGVAAVEGNGERELLRAVAGLAATVGGTLSVEQPVSLIPEDRTTEGIIAEFSITENLTLGLGEFAPWVHRGLIDHAAAGKETARILRQYEVAAPGPDMPAGTLSGGNQQKLILARALERAPRVLVAENPGRGLDIRAARLSFERLRAAARQGAAVLIYSSDLAELFDWCDRILVVTQGEVHPPPFDATHQLIGRLMLGVKE
jgi:ABC-type uncharacterized transport system ATPase subunit